MDARFVICDNYSERATRSALTPVTALQLGILPPRYTGQKRHAYVCKKTNPLTENVVPASSISFAGESCVTSIPSPLGENRKMLNSSLASLRVNPTPPALVYINARASIASVVKSPDSDLRYRLANDLGGYISNFPAEAGKSGKSGKFTIFHQ